MDYTIAYGVVSVLLVTDAYDISSKTATKKKQPRNSLNDTWQPVTRGGVGVVWLVLVPSAVSLVRLVWEPSEWCGSQHH